MRILLIVLLSCACCAMNVPARAWVTAAGDTQSARPEMCERSQPIVCPLLRSSDLAGWWMSPNAIALASAAVHPHDAFSAGPEALFLRDFVPAGTLQSLAVRLQI